MPLSSIYSKTIAVPASVIDENGHVNNAAYVQWMQDIAVEHYASLGGLEAQMPFGTWSSLAISHKPGFSEKPGLRLQEFPT